MNRLTASPRHIPETALCPHRHNMFFTRLNTNILFTPITDNYEITLEFKIARTSDFRDAGYYIGVITRLTRGTARSNFAVACLPRYELSRIASLSESVKR